MLPDESEGFAPEDAYMPDLVASLAAVSPDRTAELEAQVTMFRERATAAEAENMRLEYELAKAKRDLVISEEALNTAEDELEQAIKHYPPPEEVAVLRQDLRDILTVVALHAPPGFRPSVIMDRLAAAAGPEAPNG